MRGEEGSEVGGEFGFGRGGDAVDGVVAGFLGFEVHGVVVINRVGCCCFRRIQVEFADTPCSSWQLVILGQFSMMCCFEDSLDQIHTYISSNPPCSPASSLPIKVPPAPALNLGHHTPHPRPAHPLERLYPAHRQPRIENAPDMVVKVGR